jgi:hypothetical protein
MVRRPLLGARQRNERIRLDFLERSLLVPQSRHGDEDETSGLQHPGGLADDVPDGGIAA